MEEDSYYVEKAKQIMIPLLGCYHREREDDMREIIKRQIFFLMNPKVYDTLLIMGTLDKQISYSDMCKRYNMSKQSAWSLGNKMKGFGLVSVRRKTLNPKEQNNIMTITDYGKKVVEGY